MSEADAAKSARTPAAEYERQRAYWAEQTASWLLLEGRLSRLRLIAFALAAATGWLAFGVNQISGGWIVPPVLLFGALLIAHDRVIQRRRRAERTEDFFARGLSRLDGSWPGTGQRGEDYRDPGHPYADDLDLFGEASFFELLCTARTRGGEERLASWLLEGTDAAGVRARQQAVRELAPLVALRRDLALLGEDIGSQLAPERLIEWGRAEGHLSTPLIRPLAALFSLLTIAGLATWLLTDAGIIPFLGAAAAQSVFAAALRSRVRPVLLAASAPGHDLAILSGVLERIEAEPFTGAALLALRQRLETRGEVPSRRIAQLRRLIDLLDARRNQFFAPIGALLLWSTHIAVSLERWRATCGDSLAGWLDAASEVEALCCLAGYAYEHPDDIFPEIVDDGPLFEGEGLGHPLLPADSCVRNDVSIGGERRALMMSGSNMSGKSTLLRTVGSLTMLALAGAPVRARGLRLSALQVAASIRISDSLQQGASHFFAEITRLRQVVDLTEAGRPVLFLLDEVLHGTNSHDRRIGADAVLRGLVERGAIGIVTTHDLALARIADELAPAIENVHFQDEIVDGRMHFDYRLRPGIVTKSNAIELMRSVGLDV